MQTTNETLSVETAEDAYFMFSQWGQSTQSISISQLDSQSLQSVSHSGSQSVSQSSQSHSQSVIRTTPSATVNTIILTFQNRYKKSRNESAAMLCYLQHRPWGSFLLSRYDLTGKNSTLSVHFWETLHDSAFSEQYILYLLFPVKYAEYGSSGGSISSSGTSVASSSS